MNRKWLLLLSVLVMLLSLTGKVFGAEYAEMPAEFEATQYVSLAEAQAMAAANSHDVKLAALRLEEAQVQLEQAQAAQIMQPSPTLLIQAQAGYDLAMQGYIMAQDDLVLTVKTDFYTVLQLENMLNIAEEGLESALRQLNVAEMKFEAGTVTRLDVIQASRNVLNSEAGVVQAGHGLDLAVLKFRQSLGLALDADVRPAAEAFEVVERSVDLEEDLRFALENREEIRQLRVAVEVARKSVELADNEYTPALELRMARLQLEQTMVQFEQVKQLLTLEMRQSYIAMQDARQRIPVLEKGVEEAQELLRLSELMYDADMITANDMQDAQLAVMAARNDLVSAITDFNIAQARYRHTVASALREQ